MIQKHVLTKFTRVYLLLFVLLSVFFVVSKNKTLAIATLPGVSNRGVLIGSSTPTMDTITDMIGTDGSWCGDADKGSYFVSGACQDNTGTYADFCDSQIAREYYCSGTWNGSKYTHVGCQKGGYVCSKAYSCTNGACITAVVPTATATQTPKPDTIAPWGFIQINQGKTITNSSLVMLGVMVSDNVDPSSRIQMEIANEPTFIGTSWSSFTPNLYWTMVGNSGPSTVYARFQDSSRNISQTFRASIIIDKFAPGMGQILLSRGGPTVAKNSMVSILVSAFDDVALSKVDFYINSVLVASRPVSPVTSTYSYLWVVPSVTNATYNIMVVATDSAGNTTTRTYKTIAL